MSTVEELLARGAEQRLREYKYRCAQSIVFGIPVIALQLFGHRLGGAESHRWVSILQALLTGWIMYVAAAGMLFEGAIRLRHRITPDFVVAVIAIGLFLWSLIAAVVSRPAYFHLAVAIIAVWTAIQWTRSGVLLRASQRLSLLPARDGRRVSL